MAKKVLIGLTLIFVAAAVLVLRPVPRISEEKAVVESGIVTSIYEGGVKDVVFHLKDNDRKFYINRGLENGLELASLREKLMGQMVVVKYPKYWTPLDWDGKVKHISKMEFQDEVIFSEFAD